MNKMQQKQIPGRLRQVLVALVGAHAAGFIYLAAATVSTGTVSLTTPTHWVILAIAVGATISVAWPFLKIGSTPATDDELEERFA